MGQERKPLTRSEQMGRIKSRDTKPEMLLRSALWKTGLRYRLNCRVLGTRPDIVFVKQKIAVFVDGCQWHGCPNHYVAPRTRPDFWQNKLRQTVNRDSRQTLLLEASGWRAIRVWEHNVWENLEHVVLMIGKALQGEWENNSEDWRVFHVESSGAEDNFETRYMGTLKDLSITKTIRQVRSTAKWSRKSHQSE